MAEALLHTTTSLCGRCKKSLPAQIWRRDGRIFMRKRCAEHGAQEVLLSSSAAWYEGVMAQAPALTKPPVVKKEVSQGCPYDCGACSAHEQRIHLPIVEITSACSFDCPKCWVYNKNGPGAYHMGEEELRGILATLRKAAPDKRIINLTGGEPTQHPNFQRLVELCHEEGIQRITISTFGIRFLKDEALVKRLKEIDARIILSFDSFTPEGVKAMMGEGYLEPKLRVLEVLEKHGVNTSLLAVVGRGVNDAELGRFLKLALEKDFIRSLELHPFTFTGHGGAGFDRGARYTTYDALCDLERHTEGQLRVSDFVPAPVAHPLCYQVTYLLRTGERDWLPFPRFMHGQDLRDLLTGSLYLAPSPQAEATIRSVIDRLWAGELDCERREDVLLALKRLTERLSDPVLGELDRMRAAERETKAVYVHTHMDEESFDTDRIRQCPVGVPRADGTNMPSCSYTVLYRERDPKFMATPKPPLSTLGPGRIDSD